jgi:hypothetical protein
VARQPILISNENEQVPGYELLFRVGGEDYFQGTDADAASRSKLIPRFSGGWISCAMAGTHLSTAPAKPFRWSATNDEAVLRLRYRSEFDRELVDALAGMKLATGQEVTRPLLLRLGHFSLARLSDNEIMALVRVKFRRIDGYSCRVGIASLAITLSADQVLPLAAGKSNRVK